MSNRNNMIPIPGRLHSVAVGEPVAGADEIYDDTQAKDQKTINSELIQAVGTGGSVDSRIADAKDEIIGDAATDYNTLGKLEDKIQAEASARESAVSAEATRAKAAEEQLRTIYNNLQQSQPIPVTALPATGEAGKIYRLAGTNSYADYMYAEGALTTPIKMAEYDNAIDDAPTAGSENLVKSEGIVKYNLSLKDDNDTEYPNEPYYTLGVFPIKVGDTVIMHYTYESSRSCQCFFYDKDDNYIDYYSSNNPSGTRTFTNDITGSAYMRVLIHKHIINSVYVQINGGSVIYANNYIHRKDGNALVTMSEQILLNAPRKIADLPNIFKGIYITTDNNDDLTRLSNAAVTCYVINLSLITRNIVISPFKPASNFYFRVWFFDNNNHLTGYYNTTPSFDDGTLVIDKTDIPSGTTQGYLDVPTSMIDDITIEYNKKYYFNTGLFSFAGNNDTYVEGTIKYIEPNQTYKIIIDNPDYDRSGDTSTEAHSVFSVGYFYSGGYKNLIYVDYRNKVQKEYTFKVPENATGLYVGGRATSGVTVTYTIEKYYADVDIVSVNSGLSSTILDQFNKKITSLSGVAQNETPVVLLHFSDVHADYENFDRIAQYFDYYKININGVIHTGDSVADHFGNSFDFWNNSLARTFLNVIGNHDTAERSGSSYDWLNHVGVDAYNKYFSPYISNWNVVQPLNAASLGLCYYYKDFGYNVRLIVIDDMEMQLSGDTQLSWFEDVLSDARTNNKHVIVASHYPNDIEPFNCPFHCIGSEQWGVPYANRSGLISKVDAFISAGGKFVTWLTGHNHQDGIGLVKNTTNPQLCISVDTAQVQEVFSNTRRNAYNKSRDLFNIVKIDSYRNTISLCRIGADFDADGRHIGTVVLDYINGKLINYW